MCVFYLNKAGKKRIRLNSPQIFSSQRYITLVVDWGLGTGKDIGVESVSQQGFSQRHRIICALKSISTIHSHSQHKNSFRPKTKAAYTSSLYEEDSLFLNELK